MTQKLIARRGPRREPVTNTSSVPCAICGSQKKVRWVTPDMDIEPVPLCVICRWSRLSAFSPDRGAVDTGEKP